MKKLPKGILLHSISKQQRRNAMEKDSIDFVHLHVHSGYSLEDGAIKIGALVERAVQFGMDAVAITDHAVMYGVPEFYKKARKAGIKPIIGCECNLVDGRITGSILPDDKPYHLMLLADNMVGYRNLCKLVSFSHIKGFHSVPCTDRKMLTEYSNGLIGLSGCLRGEIPRKILEDNFKASEQAARMYVEIFGENNFFLETQVNGMKAQEEVNQVLAEMSDRLSIQMVATNNCHYLDRTDALAHDVLLCIRAGTTVDDKNRTKFETDQFHFKSKEEMYACFKSHPSALDNSINIARRCDLELGEKRYSLPRSETDPGQTSDECLKQQPREGLMRVVELLRKKNPGANTGVYSDRLEKEITTITSKGFSRYFLIVSDYVRYAKTHGTPVGPGRGSMTGSLVAYCLGITGVDPIAARLRGGKKIYAETSMR